jgi:hypothetical protein
MKNYNSALLFAALAVILTGCDKAGNATGASATAGSSESSTASAKADTARDTSISLDKSATVAVKVSAWLYLQEAIGDLQRVDNEKLAKVFVLSEEQNKELQKVMSVFADAAQATTSFSDKKLLAAIQSGKSDYVKSWVKNKSTNINFASNFSYFLLKNVNSAEVGDEEELKTSIQMLIAESIKNGTVQKLWEQSAADANLNGLKFNFSGQQKHPVEFVQNGVLYAQDQNGWHIIKLGVEWFGAGKVAAREIELTINQSDNSSLSKKASVGNGMSNETRSNADASAGSK